jgi:diguanylate cyclase (GGDEF)-like protein
MKREIMKSQIHFNSVKEFKERNAYIISIIAISLLMFFTLIHSMKYEVHMALFEFIMGTVWFVLFFLYIKGKIKNYFRELMLTLTIVIILGLIINGGTERTGIFWTFTFPVIASSILETEKATIWEILLQVIIILTAVVSGIGFLKIAYSYQELLLALAPYTAIGVFLHLYSKKLDEDTKLVMKLAAYDALTGLFNRGFIFKLLEKETEKVTKQKSEKAIIIYIDLDNFKEVNDNYGHRRGDEVLKTIADIISTHFAGNYVARIGGDEFLVFLRRERFNRKEIEEKLEDLKRKIEKELAMFDISISYGISVIPDDAISISDAIHLADMDMYSKKNAKKNNNPRILNFSQVKSSQL